MAKAKGSTNENSDSTEATATVVRKKRAPNPAIQEEQATIKAWKEAGNKGLPPGVKVAAFKRLAVPRTKRALKAIAQLRALSNRSQYSFTEEDAAKIMSAIGDALESLDKAFAPKDGGVKEFTL